MRKYASRLLNSSGKILVCLVHLVCLVYFVYLVSFTQPKKPDKPDRPDNGLLTLADFFSMLSAFLGRVGHKRRIELPHLGAAALRAFHVGGFMFL
jgi:hypothetical protein